MDKYTNKVLDEIDPHVAKMHALNLGYQAGFMVIPKPVNSRRNMDTASRGLF